MKNSKIEDYAKILKLPFIRTYFEQFATQAEIEKPSYESFLEQLLEREVEARNERAIQNRIRGAKFPHKVFLDELELGHYSLELQRRIKDLMTLSFIDNHENVLLIGNPGVGKTALALGLGLQACMKNKTVLFLNVSDLIIQLKEAMSQNQILLYKKRFQRYDLIILDEFGFVSFDKQSSEVLFNILSSRMEKGSMIITSNLTVDKWNEIFHDQLLTTALVDRLAFKSHLLDMSGESYRVKSTKEWQKQRYN